MSSMAPRYLSLFICGDFHAYDGGAAPPDPPSWFNTQHYGDRSSCPVSQLVDFLNEERITADIAVNCGDLADKANPSATGLAWKAFHQLADAVKAPIRIATAGNHDLDSRFHSDYDAKGCIQALDPPFPIADESQFDRYWSRHFFMMESDDYRLVCLNSAAYHGYQEEYQHGRVSPRTLERLERAIQAGGPRPVNILICHHPPQHQSESGQGEADNMIGGADLIAALAANPSNQWLIVHGHKHYPKLQYARGSNDAPVILSAGSISAIPYPRYGKDGKNQVHLIGIDLDDAKASGMRGVVKTYEWATAGKWRLSSRDGGLPAECGFGNRATSVQNAARIAAAVKGRTDWSEVLRQCPEVRFLPGKSLDSLFSILESQFNIVATFSRDGEPMNLTQR